MLAPILLLSPFALASNHSATCEVAKSSILSRSSTGLPQVSNLAMIEIKCSVAERRFPSRPGESRNALQMATTAYLLSADGSRKEVPSKTNASGGGDDGETEYVSFDIELPLDQADRGLEARRYLDRLLEKSTMQVSDSDRKRLVDSLAEDGVSQHRTGIFHIDCKMLDGALVYGIGGFDLEVVFKGRFSDHYGLPGYWEAPQPPSKP
jgi:hypothetical protein